MHPPSGLVLLIQQQDVPSPAVSRLPLSICVTSLIGLCAGADVEMCSAAGPKVAS